MGNAAVRNAFEGAKVSINLREIPSAVFTDPQVAAVGYTEEEYMERMGHCSCRTVEMGLVPKAQIIRDTRGLVKVVADPKTKRLVGGQIVAHNAAELIHELTIAVKFGLTIDDIIETTHVFPTMSEGTKRACQAFYRDVSKMSCCIE
jgi:mercuric reductase